MDVDPTRLDELIAEAENLRDGFFRKEAPRVWDFLDKVARLKSPAPSNAAESLAPDNPYYPLGVQAHLPCASADANSPVQAEQHGFKIGERVRVKEAAWARWPIYLKLEGCVVPARGDWLSGPWVGVYFGAAAGGPGARVPMRPDEIERIDG